jgi:hypothetical protein
MGHRKTDVQPFEPSIFKTAAALLSSALREVEEIDSILGRAMSGRFA